MTFLHPAGLVTFEERLRWLGQLARRIERVGYRAVTCPVGPIVYLGARHPLLAGLVVTVTVEQNSCSRPSLAAQFRASAYPGAPCGAWLAPVGNAYVAAIGIFRIIDPWVRLTMHSTLAGAARRQVKAGSNGC